MSARALELFSTPVHVRRVGGVEALNAELRERLVAESRRSEGLSHSNVGGWHSGHDLLLREEACFVRLRDLFLGGVREALAAAAAHRGQTVSPALSVGGVAWAMVMPPGAYSTVHHHGDAHWAGVYYVDAGDGEASGPAGCLSLLDPRGGAHTSEVLPFFTSAFDIRPADGLLVFFPAWLLHHVHPYGGTRPRVSVACNFHVKAG